MALHAAPSPLSTSSSAVLRKRAPQLWESIARDTMSPPLNRLERFGGAEQRPGMECAAAELELCYEENLSVLAILDVKDAMDEAARSIARSHKLGGVKSKKQFEEEADAERTPLPAHPERKTSVLGYEDPDSPPATPKKPNPEYTVVFSAPGPLGVRMLKKTLNGRNIVTLDAPVFGGQASRAGVISGSRLTAVNGQSVAHNEGPDYYEVLDISLDASSAEIRKAYKRKALEAHPDRGGRGSVFDSVHAAFVVLSDDRQRRDYDAGVDSADFEKAMRLIQEAGRPLTLDLVRPHKEPT